MYDIYANNPPKNEQEITDYLISWLQVIENGPVKFYQNQTWIQKYGFKRAFQIHGVYVNTISNEHIFHVDEYDWETGV